jgi:hypothetical protein
MHHVDFSVWKAWHRFSGFLELPTMEDRAGEDFIQRALSLALKEAMQFKKALALKVLQRQSLLPAVWIHRWGETKLFFVKERGVVVDRVVASASGQGESSGLID